MAVKKNASKLQEGLAQFIGSEVKVKANSGRKRYEEHTGILDGTYSNLFVVRMDDPRTPRKMSFNYVDLLTGNVILLIQRDGKEYQLNINQKIG